MVVNKTEHMREEILKLTKQYAVEQFTKPPFIPGQTPIPPSGKVIGSQELSYMVDAVLDGWLTTGRFNDLFEKKLADYLGIKHILTTNSGSSANLLAFSALTSPALGERAICVGDEVITVAAGFPTTVNPVIQAGAIPVFVDIEIPEYNINVELVESAITSKTKAIVLAHTLGNPFNLSIIKPLCEKYNLWLIEDCCDALGAKYNGEMVGSFGDIGTLSFYPAHHITMGEGGAVFTNNPQLRRILLSYRDWGRDCYCAPGEDNTCNRRYEWKLGNLPEGYDHKYIYSHVGYNLKITDTQAACALAQLDSLNNFVKKRQDNFKFLSKGLDKCHDYLILPQATENSTPSWFGFPIAIKDSAPFNRLELIKYLDSVNIGTRLLFAGNLTKQPYMKIVNFRIHGELIQTDRVMNNTFWIGVYPGLTEEMLEYVVNKITAFCTSATQ